MTKTTRPGLLAALVALAAGVSPVAGAQQAGPCDRPAETHKLKIRFDAGDKTPKEIRKTDKNSNVDSNADELHVCRGDTIEWSVQGQPEFTVDFAAGGPLLAYDKVSKKGKLTTRVRSNAPRGERYVYRVRLLDGDPAEPVIVVD